ncbi:hypothetical protein KP814_21790 [Hahella sp. HN01]|nr:hypothetical protein [Hahella sp. HN01]
MTMPKKKSRIIIVDNIAYRWRSSGNDGWLDVYVELAEAPCQLLYEQIIYGSDLSDFSITPAYVAKLIKTALDQGWSPSQYGPNFRITT